MPFASLPDGPGSTIQCSSSPTDDSPPIVTHHMRPLIVLVSRRVMCDVVDDPNLLCIYSTPHEVLTHPFQILQEANGEPNTMHKLRGAHHIHYFLRGLRFSLLRFGSSPGLSLGPWFPSLRWSAAVRAGCVACCAASFSGFGIFGLGFLTLGCECVAF